MATKKQNRRSPAETIFLQLLMHIGFTRPLLSEAPIREDNTPFGKKAVEGAAGTMKSDYAYSRYKWPVRPSGKEPGKLVTSTERLIEMSLLVSCMYYLYGEKVYVELTMQEILHAQDLYTNIRESVNPAGEQLSPDTIFWVAKEIYNHNAIIPYCPRCEIRYYSSIEQRIKHACPYCKEPGIGDHHAGFAEIPMHMTKPSVDRTISADHIR